MLVFTVEDRYRIQHQKLEVAGIALGCQIARYGLDTRVSGGECLRVPQQVKPAQAIDGFEFAIGVRFEPADCWLGFARRIGNVDLAVPDLPFAADRIAVPQGSQNVVKSKRVAQVEKRVVNLQYAIDFDDGHRLSEAFREAELVAPGAKIPLAAGPPQRQCGASRQHAEFALLEGSRHIRV